MVLWTWFNWFGPIINTLGRGVWGDIPPTRPKSLAASRCPKRPLPDPFLFSILLLRLCVWLWARILLPCAGTCLSAPCPVVCSGPCWGRLVYCPVWFLCLGTVPPPPPFILPQAARHMDEDGWGWGRSCEWRCRMCMQTGIDGNGDESSGRHVG